MGGLATREGLRHPLDAMPQTFPVHTPVVAPPETNSGVMHAWVEAKAVRARVKVGTVAVAERRIVVRSPCEGQLVRVAKIGDSVAPGAVLGFIRTEEEALVSLTERPHRQSLQGVPRLGRALLLGAPVVVLGGLVLAGVWSSMWPALLLIPWLLPWATRLSRMRSDRRLQQPALQVARRLGSGDGPAALAAGDAPTAISEGSGPQGSKQQIERSVAPNEALLQGLCRHEDDKIVLTALAEMVEHDPAAAVAVAWDLVLRPAVPTRRAAWQVIGRLGSAQDVLPALEFLHLHPYKVVDPVHAAMREAAGALKSRHPSQVGPAWAKVGLATPKRSRWRLLRKGVYSWSIATALSTLGFGLFAYAMASGQMAVWAMIGMLVLSTVLVLPLVLVFGMSSEAVSKFGNTPVTLKSGEKQAFAGQLALVEEGGAEGRLSEAEPKLLEESVADHE